MKKILCLTICSFFILLLSACGSSKNKLYLLNWGDYINDDVVERFEKENNCKVVNDDVDSNEAMYANIYKKVAAYDLAVPSDYMIEKMNQENMLKKIDTTKLSNYQSGMFVDQLEALINTNASSYKDYFIPYFWGTLGIMYNKDKAGVEEAVTTNGWDVLFEHNLLPSGSKVGMYDCARDAFAAAQLYKGYSLNTTSETELLDCKEVLKNTDFNLYGNDNLKTSVAEGSLDVALVYSGDFFDQRYQYIENEKDVTFGLYAPSSNDVFFDGFVIPTTSKNTDLAYKFIDFLLDEDNSFENTDYVGYAPVIANVRTMFEEETDEYYTDLLAIDAFNPALVTNGEIYRYLGTDYDSDLEKYFEQVRVK